MAKTKITTNLLGRPVSLTEEDNRRLRGAQATTKPMAGAKALVDQNGEIVSVWREDGATWLAVAISGHGKTSGRIVNVLQDMVTLLGKVRGS